jgi:hypothetical protein
MGHPVRRPGLEKSVRASAERPAGAEASAWRAGSRNPGAQTGERTRAQPAIRSAGCAGPLLRSLSFAGWATRCADRGLESGGDVGAHQFDRARQLAVRHAAAECLEQEPGVAAPMVRLPSPGHSGSAAPPATVSLVADRATHRRVGCAQEEHEVRPDDPVEPQRAAARVTQARDGVGRLRCVHPAIVSSGARLCHDSEVLVRPLGLIERLASMSSSPSDEAGSSSVPRSRRASHTGARCPDESSVARPPGHMTP